AVLVRQLHGLAARERHTIKLPLDGAFLRRYEVKGLRLLVYLDHPIHFPSAMRELCHLFARKIVQVKMTEARALAGPQKALSVRQKMQISAGIRSEHPSRYFEPVCVSLGEHGLGFSAARVREE